MVPQIISGYALRRMCNLKARRNFAIIPVVLAVAVACGCGGSTTLSSGLQGASTGALQITPSSVHLVAKSAQESTAVPISIRNISSHTVQVTSLVAQPDGMFKVLERRPFLLNPNQVQRLTVVFTPGWLGMLTSQKVRSSPLVLPRFACCQGTLTISTPGAVTEVGLQGEVSTAQPSKSTPQTVTIAISPSNATVQAGQSFQFTATSNGHHVPVLWSASLGSINSNGLYVAPSVSSATVDTVSATSATAATGFAVATVDVTSKPAPQPPSSQPPPSYNGSGYYMSPNGDDSNSGTASQPWKTFARAISQLKPGDNLVLENGLYTGANTGYPYVNCSSGAAKGTAAAPIIIRAQNERAAFIKGDGTAYPVAILNCQYWQLIGLHVENGDFNNRNYNGTSTTEALYGDAIFLYNDSHLTLQRNLIARNNRYANSHLVDNYYTTNSLYEENEFYYFHRHAILDMYGAYNVFRRNYFNSRGYVDLPDGRYSSNPTRGDGGIVLYPAHDEIVENNISEGQHSASEIQCAFAANFCDNDRFLGNVSLGDEYGHVFKARDVGDAYMPHNEYAENDVVLNPGLVGFYVRAVKNPSRPNCSGCTILGGNSTIGGVIADAGGSGETGDGTYQVWFRNVVSSFNQGSPGYGFQIDTSYGSWTWTLDHTVAYSNSINYYPGIPNPNIISGMTLSPQLGACKVWVPQGSPLSGAGTGGSDIGADVLYRYNNGSLTTQPLWDPSTGQFPHGAVVRGLNDVAGQSAFDVNVRLNVNSGGCSFPSNYP